MCFKKEEKTPADLEQERKNREIDADLKEVKKERDHKIRLLLLGTGDAGKSTFAKQMKVIHKDGFTQQEKEKFVSILRDNTLTSLQRIIQACRDWDINIPESQLAESIMNATALTPDLAKSIVTLYPTAAVKEAMKRENEMQLPGGAFGVEYFVQHAARFADSKFLPTEEDMIRAKMRTTGISETVFTVDKVEFTMVDVGGQRSERRKWLNCFVDVGAVIFLVAINEYDMVLEEDNKTNRMEESLKLFQKLSGSQWFLNTAFILFLNKSDLFADKIKKRPLAEFFEDYNDFAKKQPSELSEFDKSCNYIKDQYHEAFAGFRIYAHITCAIDKDNCKKVFEAIRDLVMTNHLVGVGI